MSFFERCAQLTPFLDAIRAQEPQLLLIFGDSNTANAHFTRGSKQWGELLHQELRDQCQSQSVLYLNSGISGDCTVRGLKRWHSDVARFQPNCAIFAMGTNDRRLKDAEFRAAVHRALDGFARLGSRVLVRTPIPILEKEPAPAHLWLTDSPLRERAQALCDIARERDLPLCDVYGHWHAQSADGTLDAGPLFADAVHSSALGHQHVARSILPAFGLAPTFCWERQGTAKADGTY